MTEQQAHHQRGARIDAKGPGKPEYDRHLGGHQRGRHADHEKRLGQDDTDIEHHPNR